VAVALPVVIVHRDQPERLRETIAAFRSQDVPVTIAVVDNGSTSLPDVEGPDVVVLDAGRNLGFGPGANLGFRHFLARDGEQEWIALAPHDAQPQPGCLRRMLDALETRPRAGLACADVGDDATPIVDPYFGGILAPASIEEGWEDAGHPHGTLMLARRACLEQVGLFDERYFAYCEEADLALRAAEAGWECGLVRGAMVQNTYVGSASAAIDYLQLRNTLLLVREHSGRYHAFIRYSIAVWHLASGAVFPSRRGPYWNVRGRVAALTDFARGRFGPPPRELMVR
jgi:cellulose synthase/poly-beta-1,6-N-acetylglucosamine synthase-like glycosyltransferase